MRLRGSGCLETQKRNVFKGWVTCQPALPSLPRQRGGCPWCPQRPVLPPPHPTSPHRLDSHHCLFLRRQRPSPPPFWNIPATPDAHVPLKDNFLGLPPFQHRPLSLFALNSKTSPKNSLPAAHPPLPFYPHLTRHDHSYGGPFALQLPAPVCGCSPRCHLTPPNPASPFTSPHSPIAPPPWPPLRASTCSAAFPLTCLFLSPWPVPLPPRAVPAGRGRHA